MTREEMRYKLNELRMMLNDGEHGEEQGVLVEIISELDKWEEPPIYTLTSNTISALSEGEWIPVSERLPEKNTAVLVYIDTGMKKTYCLAYWNGRVKGWEEWIGFRMLETEMGYKVLAWQPLPEPYKAESEGT